MRDCKFKISGKPTWKAGHPCSHVFLYLICLIFSCFIGYGVKAEGTSDETEDTGSKTVESIYEQASKITGFNATETAIRSTDEKVKKIVFNDDITPFLGEYGKKRAVWRIKYAGINLEESKGQEIDESFRRDFEVYIDSLSGHLLKITCHYGQTNPEECPELKAEEAEQQLNNHSSERYLGFPDEAPLISFKKALLKCHVNPYPAEEILGQYVMYTDGGCEPTPVWIISFCGLPPLPIIGGVADWIPLYQRTRSRSVVDALTGRVFFVTNTPTVPLPKEIRDSLFPKKE